MATTSKRGLNKPERTSLVNVITAINNNMENLDDAVPDSRTVNGKPLSGNVTIGLTDLPDVEEAITAQNAQITNLKSAFDAKGKLTPTVSFVTNSYINPTTGATATASTTDRTDFVRVLGGTTIEIYSVMYGGAGYAFYTENKAFIEGGGGTDTSNVIPTIHRISVPENAYFVRASIYKAGGFSKDNFYLHNYITQQNLEKGYYLDEYLFNTLKDRMDIVDSNILIPVTLTKQAGKYIANNGSVGSDASYDLYNFTTESGVTYIAYTDNSKRTICVAYCGEAYPEDGKRYGIVTFVGNGNTAYINHCNTGFFTEPKVYKVGISRYDAEIVSIVNRLNVLDTTNEQEHGKTVTTSDTANRFITAQGVQGNLTGYTLKSFTTELDAVYFIYSEIESSRAYAGLPIVLHNGISYTNNSGKGYYIIVGNGQKCYVNSLTSETTIVKKYLFDAHKNRVPNVFLMFNNVVCCGDSLTYSQVYTSSTTSRRALVSYPEAVQKITGTETATLATPGYTCKNWWDNYADQITGANKLYLIYLGTNESDSSLTNTADTDCAGDDLTQYATNATGYYGRIIRKILDTQSRCILIKIALGTTGNNRNAAIAGLGERFSVPVIENPQYLLGDMYYHYGDSTDYYNTVHMNDMGYTAFAEYIVKAINDLPLSAKYALMPKTVN